MTTILKRWQTVRRHKLSFFKGLAEAWPLPVDVPLVRLEGDHWLLAPPRAGFRRPACRVCGHSFLPLDHVVICPCDPVNPRCRVAVHRDIFRQMHCYDQWVQGKSKHSGTVTHVRQERDPSCPYHRPITAARRIPLGSSQRLHELLEFLGPEQTPLAWNPVQLRVECPRCGFAEKRPGLVEAADCPRCYVDQRLQEYYSDLLYRVRLKAVHYTYL